MLRETKSDRDEVLLCNFQQPTCRDARDAWHVNSATALPTHMTAATFQIHSFTVRVRSLRIQASESNFASKFIILSYKPMYYNETPAKKRNQILKSWAQNELDNLDNVQK